MRWLRQSSYAVVLGLVLALAGGGFLRFFGLGSRSLWADEFCTWHVSRLPVGESLRWGPELTKPPLYQFALRAISAEAKPPEWILRLPACLAGMLTIAAVSVLAWRMGGQTVGVSAAALVAFNFLQIRYSQEARPYSMLVLGVTIMTLLWHELVTRPTRRVWIGYVLAAALSFHAHYLAALVLAAHVAWWLLYVMPRRPANRLDLRAVGALAAVALLCLPMIVHYLRFRTSVFQGLSWIRPATWSGALGVLEAITFGPIWVVGVLTPALLLWVLRGRREPDRREAPTLLVIWLLCSWFGLLVISWAAHPALVDRYALPAAIPAIVLPLLVAGRLHRALPVVIAVVFMGVGLRTWAQRNLEIDPGFRELSEYLVQHADPQKDLIVLTIDRKTHPDWDDAERLPFVYYPPGELPTAELHLAPDGVTAENDVLDDPRAMYLIVLWADPFAILEKAGRRAEIIRAEGREFTQLLFSPYRLVRIAPK